MGREAQLVHLARLVRQDLLEQLEHLALQVSLVQLELVHQE
jgi:hypothetical protein